MQQTLVIESINKCDTGNLSIILILLIKFSFCWQLIFILSKEGDDILKGSAGQSGLFDWVKLGDLKLM